LNEQITLPFERENTRHIYNQFVVRVPERRDELRAFLTANEIGTDVYYPVSLHLQKCFRYLGLSSGRFSRIGTRVARNARVADFS
jgi:dTDP-4-amino-4,6-dideoxygalactose transaminase